MTDINEWSRITDPDGNQLYGVYLYKTEFTIPDGETTLSFGPANGIVGTVVACWLDPTTLTAAATIKAYQVDDDLVTLGPDYFIDYTVPNPAVETRSLRAKRMFVVGNIVIDIAGATAGDTGVIYVFVSTSADAEQASIDIGDVTLLPGTALIGKVEQPTSVAAFATEASAAVNASESTVCAAVPTGGKRYDRLLITCDNAHSYKVYGADEDFSDIANAYELLYAAMTGLAAQSGVAGTAPAPSIDVSGFAYISCVVLNGGADASTITVKHAFSD